ncbi:hypothetical protein CYMTET_56985, partial [Cymbomonas tetramitiformis]
EEWGTSTPLPATSWPPHQNAAVWQPACPGSDQCLLHGARLQGVSNATSQGQHLYVVAAFETVNEHVQAPEGRQQLVEWLDRGRVCPFYGHYCAYCHWPTSYTKWRGASTSYRTFYTSGYEPYVVVAAEGLPRYDERFVGRGWDKMSFFYELDKMGYQFWVMHDAYILNLGRPHQPDHTEEFMVTFRRNEQHWSDFQKEMEFKYPSKEAGAIEHDVMEVQESALGSTAPSPMAKDNITFGEAYRCVANRSEDVGEAITWVCGSDVLRDFNCERDIPSSCNKDPYTKADYLFTSYFLERYRTLKVCHCCSRAAVGSSVVAV